MDPQQVFCPNVDCATSGQVGYRIGVHSRRKAQYICHECKRTFVARHGTPFYRRQYDAALISQIVGLVSYGCPTQAVVKVFGVDERTVAAWCDAAGAHCERVHERLVQQQGAAGAVVEVDEMRVKLHGQIVWLAMGLLVGPQLWLGAALAPTRDKQLLRALALLVKATLVMGCAVAIIFDGLPGYQAAFGWAFRETVHTGRRGRPPLIPWDRLHLVQVTKQRVGGVVVGVARALKQGDWRQVAHLLHQATGATNPSTSLLERLNATFRNRCASLARRSRCLLHSAARLKHRTYLVGSCYNFCEPHDRLRVKLHLPRGHRWVERTPAMAAGITDHIWSIHELLSFKLPPHKATRRPLNQLLVSPASQHPPPSALLPAA